MIEYMETAVNTIVQYLQKCIKEKSFEVDYKVSSNTKFLNQILSNVKRDLQLLQKRGYKYNDNAIYQEWYAIRLLALHHFDLQESKHYIRVMWYEDPDEFDKCRDRKTMQLILKKSLI